VKSRNLKMMQKAIGFSKHPLVTNQVENSPSPTQRQPWDQAVLWLPDPITSRPLIGRQEDNVGGLPRAAPVECHDRDLITGLWCETG
jgi:hypothetical protein